MENYNRGFEYYPVIKTTHILFVSQAEPALLLRQQFLRLAVGAESHSDNREEGLKNYPRVLRVRYRDSSRTRSCASFAELSSRLLRGVYIKQTLFPNCVFQILENLESHFRPIMWQVFLATGQNRHSADQSQAVFDIATPENIMTCKRHQ